VAEKTQLVDVPAWARTTHRAAIAKDVDDPRQTAIDTQRMDGNSGLARIPSIPGRIGRAGEDAQIVGASHVAGSDHGGNDLVGNRASSAGAKCARQPAPIPH
jgi:hypothetical protein